MVDDLINWRFSMAGKLELNGFTVRLYFLYERLARLVVKIYTPKNLLSNFAIYSDKAL